jgi:two-component system NtrC family sensor kinase
MKFERNPRILLIDDRQSIHEDFRKIPGTDPGRPDFGPTDLALFDIPPGEIHEFEMLSAYQGREGFALVVASLQADQPFAMAFVDMRMPPGWDGLETVDGGRFRAESVADEGSIFYFSPPRELAHASAHATLT